ncbi:hypothetical protein [Candidatus Harpocratesius sp.]
MIYFIKIDAKILLTSILLFIICLLFIDVASARTLKYQDYPNYLFNEETCKENIFFEKKGPSFIRKINKKFDNRLEEIFKDNIAHPTYTVKMIIQDLRTYNSKFEQLCNRVETNCSGSSTKTNFLGQYSWCKTKQIEFLNLQKTKLKYFVLANTARKHRSLYEEKLARIGYRFHKYIHISSMKDLLEAIKFTREMAQYLAKHPDYGN